MEDKIINIEIPAGKKVMLCISISQQEIRMLNEDAQTISLDNIINNISTNTNIAKDLIIGRTRKQLVACARMCFIYLATEQGYTSVKIGRYLGRDHSTILNALGKYKQLLNAKDQLLLRIIAQIQLVAL
jgi:chromosomal replication initiation ATPase DnaA